MLIIPLFLNLLIFVNLSHGSLDWSADTQPGRWYKNAIEKINHMLNRKLNKNIAKNVILFLGDGNFQIVIRLMIFNSALNFPITFFYLFFVIFNNDFVCCFVRNGNFDHNCWSNSKGSIEG